MAEVCRPRIRPAYAHDDIDAFVNRIDEPVRERNVRLQQRVQANEIEDQRQHVHPAVGGR
ncbi:hypothetical protein D3C76_1884660 [compost metagenome]